MVTHTPYLTESGKIGWSSFPIRMVCFPKLEDLVWIDELQRLVFKYRMFQFLLASFQRLVLGGTNIKVFSLPPLEAAGATHEIRLS
jgi:hypothetical protein